MAYQTTTREHWWFMAAGGIVAILFGLAAVLWPGIALMSLVVLFGLYAIVAGVVELVSMSRAMSMHRVWWTHLVLGVIGIGAGILAIGWPGITALILLWIIASWAIALGVVEVVASFGSGLFLYLVSGLISILFGIVLLANPGGGALALVTVIGIFAIVRGIILLAGAIVAPPSTSAT